MKRWMVGLAVISPLWISSTAAQTAPTKAAPAKAAAPTKAAPAKSATFTSNQGYSITPPKGWTTDRSGLLGTEVIFMAKPKNGFAANMSVAMTKTRSGETIQQSRAGIDQAYPRMFNRFKWIGRGYTTVNGAPALVHTANHSMGTPPRRIWVHQVMAFKNGLMYAFTCTALDRDRNLYKATFDNALKSIRWTKRSVAPTPAPTPTLTPRTRVGRGRVAQAECDGTYAL